ncbi:MAG: hypothetical protein HYT80_04370 [Euryarchaeota archaeon]|nr:hypothetical protein [Euryarchaeota archaeon]
MSTTARIRFRSAGGSLIATIPKDVVDRERLKPGDERVVVFTGRDQAFDELSGSLPELGDWDRSWSRGRERD